MNELSPFFEKINFPYNKVREGQDKFIKQVFQTIRHSKNIMISAPTGLGKTVSALAPAIYLGKKHNKTVICLTSRQTQANQVIKTIVDISKKSGEKISYTAFIGKRNMCVHKDRDLYPAQDFNDFCKKVRETGKCIPYKNFRDSDREEDIKSIIEESINSPMNVEGFVNLVGSCKFCPYEVAGLKANGTDVVICDYNYLFSSGIREGFLGKIGKTLDECIIIVDEAHNLPERIRMSYSYNLSSDLIKLAMNELNDHIKSSKYDDYLINIKQILEDLFFDKLDSGKEIHLIEKEDFLNKLLYKFGKVSKEGIENIYEQLEDAAALIKEDKIISYVERVAEFIRRWHKLDEESYLRVLEKQVKDNKTILNLRIKCIDPSEIASNTLNKSFSSILMSGTLSPIEMYSDILGVQNCSLLELDSPFSSKNQLTLVENEVTSKYSARGSRMYQLMVDHITDILNSADDKNAIVFFPSYAFMEQITSLINITKLNRKILKEQKFMTKEDKEKFVDKFKENDDPFNPKSKVLFAITSGSFAEGLDLPGQALEMVLVVGLPLGVPDVTTQAIIRHFDKKFGKGQQYGYVYPAMSKIIQAAGRCIRTEEDKGVVVLMDSRFLFPQYAQSFPKHWKMKVANNNSNEIREFFKN